MLSRNNIFQQMDNGWRDAVCGVLSHVYNVVVPDVGPEQHASGTSFLLRAVALTVSRTL